MLTYSKKTQDKNDFSKAELEHLLSYDQKDTNLQE